MPNVTSPAALPKYIEQLLAEHKEHSAALATIESTLAKVTAALGGTTPAPAAMPAKKLGRPFKSESSAAATVPATKPAPAKKGPKATGMTANEFVLSYIGSHKSPTTKEINDAWKADGRSGTADNSLSLLNKAKKIKRTKLVKPERGSVYSVL
jgi:hypothetical protein